MFDLTETNGGAFRGCEFQQSKILNFVLGVRIESSIMSALMKAAVSRSPASLVRFRIIISLNLVKIVM